MEQADRCPHMDMSIFMEKPDAMIIKVLTIAGSDSGNGAGIQADLRIFHYLGLYGLSALTAVTAQNTLGVQAVFPSPRRQLAAQLRSITSDMRPVVTKTGMLPAVDIIDEVYENALTGALGQLVIDPVLASTGGVRLVNDECAQQLMKKLIPVCRLVTPNLDEAALLTGRRINNGKDASDAARDLVANGAEAACVTGGHWQGEPVDYLFDGLEITELSGKRVGSSERIHGTGCFFSAAAAGYLALGKDVPDALAKAKSLIEIAIRDAVRPGEGMPVPWLKSLSR